MPLWTTAFFAVMLAAIATLPLVAGHWWERNRNKLLVSVVLSLPVLLFLVAEGIYSPIGHAAEEYFAFIVLIGSLFIISGGILVEGDIQATPLVNSAFLALGALLAELEPRPPPGPRLPLLGAGAQPIGLHGASSLAIEATRRPPSVITGGGPEPER